MYKLWATLIKDFRILLRDKVGLILMFAMPVMLAIVIAAVQNSTFELVNDNKVPLLLCNHDSGKAGIQLSSAIEKIGMFEVTYVAAQSSDAQIIERMHSDDALISIVIPNDFSEKTSKKAESLAGRALSSFGVATDTSAKADTDPITLYYHPVLQESFRHSIRSAMLSSIQLVESRQVLQSIYFSLNNTDLPESLNEELTGSRPSINEIPVSRDGSRSMPNATQHNIPAWTIFAMFFIVISLGSGVVKERSNGSFIRLRTLPTNYVIALLSKQITYLGLTMMQAAVIFAIGAWLFPLMGLPGLNFPSDILGLFVVVLVCGWCAVSYAICVGVFAQTQEQANGFGAVSIVLLAAIGGILVPAFAMPDSFQAIMKISPLHWCLESFYELFLEGGRLGDTLINILLLFVISLTLQLLTFWRLKNKKLI